jgi:ketosteroid isomerase-like protein
VSQVQVVELVRVLLQAGVRRVAGEAGELVYEGAFPSASRSRFTRQAGRNEMHPNAQLVKHFYATFTRRDAAAMAACYTPDATFHDGMFGELQGDEIRAMWQMLCERGTDLQVSVMGVDADDENGRAHWEATYTFPQTGRRVHNTVDAQFRFRDGRISEHRDSFSVRRWMTMALGWKGRALGATPQGHLLQDGVPEPAWTPT